MKKRLCMALGVLLVAMSIMSPMAVWAEPETEPPADSNPPAADMETPPADSGSSDSSQTAGKTDKNTQSSGNKTTVNSNGINNVVTLNPPAAESTIKKGVISIAFSHDMHSHMDSERLVKNGKTVSIGGFPRLVTSLKAISPDYKNDTYLLDGGDFSMGTAYQTIYASQASELRMMGYVGYDAATLGNHEFDYRSKGLSSMLSNAVTLNRKGEKWKLPQVVAGNIDWERTLAEEELAADAKVLKKSFEKYGVRESYTVIKKNGTRIAVFGIFGKESDDYAPESGTYFKDQIESAKKIVKEIKDNEKKVDMIVCLSHSGTKEDKEESEDELLAEAVPEIDLIISGHTHTELKEPIKVGNTVIASCGAYNHNLGYMTFKKKDGKYALDSYRLIPLSSSVAEDAETLQQLEAFKALSDREYFSKYGYSIDSVLTKNRITFTAIEDFGQVQGEDTLGNLITDSYIYAVKKSEGKNYREVDVAVVPSGVVRASLPKGNVTVSDAFNVLSLGVGADGTPGYPLVSAYLTGKELKALAEVDATVSDMMLEARLYMSGLSYTINSSRLILNRACDIKKGTGEEAVELDNKKLYRIVTDLYSCQMLGSVKDKSFGLLSIVPKDEEGNIILDYEDHIINGSKGELKAWYAFASYLDSKSSIPSEYAEVSGRKILTDSKALGDLLKQPNKVGWLARLAVIIPLLAIAIIVAAVRIRRRKRDSSMLFPVSERQKKAIFAPPKKNKNIFARKNKRWFK